MESKKINSGSAKLVDEATNLLKDTCEQDKVSEDNERESGEESQLEIIIENGKQSNVTSNELEYNFQIQPSTSSANVEQTHNSIKNEQVSQTSPHHIENAIYSNLPKNAISKEGKKGTIEEFPDYWDNIYKDNDDHPFHKLCVVIRDGDIERFKVMQVENGCVCAVRDKSGDSILHLAAKYGQFEMCNILVRYLNVNTEKSWTPLHYAAMGGHNEIVQLFLEQKAEINAIDSNGQTPLHITAKHGHLQSAKLLLDWGAGNQVKDGGNTLEWMVDKQHHTVVELLLSKTAKINVKDHFNYMPIHLASEDGHLELVQLLLDRNSHVSPRSNNDRTPLHLAAEKGHNDVCRLLLEHGAEVDLKDSKSGWTPLHFAINSKLLDLIALLLKANANLNIPDESGISALQFSFDKKMNLTNLLHYVVHLELTDDASYKIVEKAMLLNLPNILRFLVADRDVDGNLFNKEITVEHLEEKLDDCIGEDKKLIFINFNALLASNFQKFTIILPIFLYISKDKKFEHLLQHPVIKTYLKYKWAQVSKYFYLNVIFYLITCVSMLVYQYTFYCGDTFEFTISVFFLFLFIIISFIFLLIKEIVQFSMNYRMYLENVENYLEILMICYIFIIIVWYPDVMIRKTLTALGNILLAVTLTMMIGHHPMPSVAVHLLRTVSFKFFKFFIVYLPIILSFTTCFYQLNFLINTDIEKAKTFNGSVENEITGKISMWNHPLSSILRTIGMFVGELNLDNFFNKQINWVLIILLIGFVLFISVIILNLLNGLAISNILEKNELKISYYKSQVEYLYNLNNNIQWMTTRANAMKNNDGILNCLKRIFKKIVLVAETIPDIRKVFCLLFEFIRFIFRIVKKILFKLYVKLFKDLFAPSEIKSGNIFVLPNYTNYKILDIDSNQDHIYSNKIHKEAYNRLKKKNIIKNKINETKEEYKNLSCKIEEIKKKIGYQDD